MNFILLIQARPQVQRPHWPVLLKSQEWINVFTSLKDKSHWYKRADVMGEEETWTMVHRPLLWTDHFHGPGPWPPCYGTGPWTLFYYYRTVFDQVHGRFIEKWEINKNRNSAKENVWRDTVDRCLVQIKPCDLQYFSLFFIFHLKQFQCFLS